jgi:hypothetical protein
MIFFCPHGFAAAGDTSCPKCTEHDELATARAEIAALRAQVEMLTAALEGAGLQIEYLHDKFDGTGSGNAILAQIRAALMAHTARGE